MAQPYQLPDLIIARLEGLGYPVYHYTDVFNAREGAQIAPAYLVMPYTLAVSDDGDETAIRESVLVAAVVRFSNQRSGQGARQLAGPMLAAAAVQLKDWQPSITHTALVMESPPPPTIDAGFSFYPLQYTSTYSLTE